MKKILTFFLLLLFIPPVFSQTKSNSASANGIWLTDALIGISSPNELSKKSFNWQAQWIWLNEKNESDVMLARRSFDLPMLRSAQVSQIPNEAHLRITATSQYQLYLNGKYIAQGPSRCAPHHQSFDIWDVSSLLEKGKNTIAVRVHRQRGKYSYHLDGSRAGLLVQLDYTNALGESKSLISDNNWKVIADPSWSNEAKIISRFQMVVDDKVDMRKHIKGWKQKDFDDSNWPKATPLLRKVGWPSVQKNAKARALTPPWTTLVPRDVPYLIETQQKAFNLIEAKTISSEQAENEKPIPLTGELDKALLKKFKSYKKGKQALIIPPAPSGKKHFLLFDLGTIRNGMAQLEIEGAAGTMVEVRSAPFIVSKEFNNKVVFSDFNDQIILSGNRDQWEATYWKPTRYMALVIDNNSTIHLHKAGIRYLNYPFQQKGSMRSADAPWVEQYMNATAKTIDVCTTDGYTDNYRERRQYAQTGYYGAMGNYWIYGDHLLQRRYLVQVAQEQEANGMMPAYAPLAKDDYMIIMDSNCLYIRSLRDYFLHSGDEPTVRQLLPAARKLMALLHSYTNDLGLIDNPPYPYWLDHAVIDRRGANLNLNGHYIGALEDFTKVLQWLGESDHEVFKQRAELARKSIQENFWDEEKQVFADALIDGKRSEQFGEHANAMALATKAASPEQAKQVAKQLLENDELNYVKRASGMIMVTPAMSYFLHKGLCNYGYTDESLALFRRRFDKMLTDVSVSTGSPNTNQTLFEEWWLDKTGRSGQAKKTSRSDAQTESCFPPALFGEFLLGVRPTEPGMKEVEIYRCDSDLRQMEGQVPSPHGLLSVNWQFAQTGGGQLSVEIPKGMQVKLNLKSLSPNPQSSIQIDNQELSSTDRRKPFVMLTEGRHDIKF